MLEEAERAAAEVLAAVPRWLWNGETPPVPVEEIADSYFGLHVREVEDLAGAPGAPSLANGQTLSGLLLAGPREIWINAGEALAWPPRRRFTIGHEVGHWVLHRERAATAGGVFCRHAAVEAEVVRPALAPEEQEANAFAAELLMPAAMVRRCYEVLKARGEDPFAVLCHLFGSSQAAMGRRLHRAVPRGAGG